MPVPPYDFSAPRLAPPDGSGGSRPPVPLRVQFDLDPSEWPVRALHPSAFSTPGTAVLPGQTVTATLTIADTLTVTVRAQAHPAAPDNTQWFSIVYADEELLSLLARLAR
jgi:hypothetical protein